MRTCTDKSDAATLSSSSEFNTAVDDIISKGIKKVTLDDDNNTLPCDISSSREEDMNSEKKCISCEQNLDHIKTNEISYNSASSNADIDSVSGEIVGDAKEVSTCANCGKEGATNTCNKCKSVKYCNAAVRKGTDQNIRNSARGVWPNYMI